MIEIHFVRLSVEEKKIRRWRIKSLWKRLISKAFYRWIEKILHKVLWNLELFLTKLSIHFQNFSIRHLVKWNSTFQKMFSVLIHFLCHFWMNFMWRLLSILLKDPVIGSNSHEILPYCIRSHNIRSLNTETIQHPLNLYIWYFYLSNQPFSHKH